jgi:hypothetical protein
VFNKLFFIILLSLCFSCSFQFSGKSNPKYAACQEKTFEELLRDTPPSQRQNLAKNSECVKKFHQQHPDFNKLPIYFWLKKYGASNLNFFLTEGLLDQEQLQSCFHEISREKWSLGNYLDSFQQEGLELLYEFNFISKEELALAWGIEKQEIKSLDFLLAWGKIQRDLNDVNTINFLKKEGLLFSAIDFWEECNLSSSYNSFIKNKSFIKCFHLLSPTPLILTPDQIPIISDFSNYSGENSVAQKDF